jgi:hypothetical protein
MTRMRTVATVLFAVVVLALQSPGLMAKAPGQLPTLHIAGAAVSFKGQHTDELTAGTKGKLYTIEIIGVGFDASAKVLFGGMKVPVISSSPPNMITAKLRGAVLVPGQVSLQVVNPDGDISNALILDVASDPSVLSIDSISPDNGLIGAPITITGVGFTPTGNRIQLVKVSVPTLQGLGGQVASADGKTLIFHVPDGVCPACVYANPGCAVACLAVSPGSYHLSITNANGLSNSRSFLVDSPSGPIGVWGVTGEKVVVTDTQVMVEGACFSGMIPQTLTPDAGGNFNMSGSFTRLVGPVGLSVPAQFSGSITGSIMTITITTDTQTLGPFTLTFGDDVQIVHPCV